MGKINPSTRFRSLRIDTESRLWRGECINFTKMVASGNDFAVITGDRVQGAGFSSLAKKICDRKFGIGADGLLWLGKSKTADVRMRIFNADGSEAEMCGNGARCIALYASSELGAGSSELKIETKAGIVAAKVNGDNNVKIKLTDPRGIKLDIPIKINARILKVNFINTGVPHAVIFTEGVEKFKITELGRFIRYHQSFAPKGANVDFVEALDRHSLRIRTYERGVEDETLACGTGSVAAALIFALKGAQGNKIKLHTQSGEVLEVYFERWKNNFHNVWLEGTARVVYKGEYYV